mgnify:CR=1 FL=1
MVTELQTAFASAQRVFDLLDTEPEISSTNPVISPRVALCSRNFSNECLAMNEATGIARIVAVLLGTILLAAVFQWLMTLCTNIVTYRTVAQLRAE